MAFPLGVSINGVPQVVEWCWIIGYRKGEKVSLAMLHLLGHANADFASGIRTSTISYLNTSQKILQHISGLFLCTFNNCNYYACNVVRHTMNRNVAFKIMSRALGMQTVRGKFFSS